MQPITHCPQKHACGRAIVLPGLSGAKYILPGVIVSVVVRVLAQESVFKSWLCLYQIMYLTSLCLSLIICKMEEMIIDLS